MTPRETIVTGWKIAWRTIAVVGIVFVGSAVVTAAYDVFVLGEHQPTEQTTGQTGSAPASSTIRNEQDLAEQIKRSGIVEQDPA